MSRHARLVEEDAALWVDPAGDQSGRHVADICEALGAALMDTDRVEIGEEEEAARVAGHLVLHARPVADRAQIIAEVEIAGRLDAGKKRA